MITDMVNQVRKHGVRKWPESLIRCQAISDKCPLVQ